MLNYLEIASKRRLSLNDITLNDSFDTHDVRHNNAFHCMEPNKSAFFDGIFVFLNMFLFHRPEFNYLNRRRLLSGG